MLRNIALAGILTLKTAKIADIIRRSVLVKAIGKMDQPVKPRRPELPVKTRLEKQEVRRVSQWKFPYKLGEDLPANTIIDIEFEGDGDDGYDFEMIISREIEVENSNYEEEVRRFDVQWAAYLDAMTKFKADMKAWKADERNRADQIQANKNRIKQLQDEIKLLEKQG